MVKKKPPLSKAKKKGNNPKGNPDLHKHGKKFGEDNGNDPSAAAKKGNEIHGADRHAVRRNIKRFGGLDCDILKDPAAIEKHLGRPSGKLSGFEMVALMHVREALRGSRDDMLLLQHAVDGKIADKTITHKVDYAALITGIHDEDDDEI